MRRRRAAGTRFTSTSSCAADSWRHGKWVPTATRFPSSLACSNYSFANETCAPHELSVATMCHNLRHTNSVLMVGDSLMLHAFLGLLGLAGAKERVEPCDSPVNTSGFDTKKSKRLPCSPCCCRAFVLPCKQRPIRVRFVRHNHLLGEFLPKPAPIINCYSVSCRRTLGLRVSCTSWQKPEALQHAQTLILGTGSHLEDVPHNATAIPKLMARGAGSAGRIPQGTSAFAEDDVFARRADELASFVHAAHPERVIFLASPWGELHYTRHSAGPVDEPEPPYPMYSWDGIPYVNAQYTRAMRAKGFLVVDPSLALNHRPDCRKDYLHSGLGVYIGSTWRLLQAAIGALAPVGASSAMTISKGVRS